MKHNRDPESETEIVSCTRQNPVELENVKKTALGLFERANPDCAIPKK